MPLADQISILKGKQKEKANDLKQPFKPETLIESPERNRKLVAKTFEESRKDAVHAVRITCFENGPFSFYVQLVSVDDARKSLQATLAKLKFHPSQPTPIEGETCVVKMKNTDQWFRARVLKNNTNKMTIQLLEDGSKLEVHSKSLYKLPVELSEEAVLPFATQYQLDGITRTSIKNLEPDEVDFYFERVTKDKLLSLKIVSDDGKSEQTFTRLAICLFFILFQD